MNNQLLQKIIVTNDVNVCPEFTFENSLIDRQVASALARSFVKILCVSQQDSNINNNLRYSVLANIRKLCRIEPENHLEVDENFTKSLVEVYTNSIRSSQTNEAEKKYVELALDKFLVRRMKEVDLSSSHQCSRNPDVVQALLNLSNNHSYVETISRDVLHWNVSDKKNLALVKNLWTNSCFDNCVKNTNICDMSIKMISEIEVILLNLCHRLLTESNLQAENLFSENTLVNLVKKCSISPECFQICTRILNYIFIHTNYNTDIKMFLSEFVKNVKTNCSNNFCILYPVHLSFIVVLLDIDLDTLPNEFKHKYIEQTLVYLKQLHEECDSDLILLLSHFSEWFSIYFELQLL